MIRTKFKKLIEIWYHIFITMIVGIKIPLIEIKLRFPVCGISMIGANGTRKRKNGQVEVFICKNPDCKNEVRKTPKNIINYPFQRIQI